MTTTFMKAKNNATTTLNGGINDTTQTVVVTDGAVFPSTFPFPVLVDSEIMLCTTRTGNTLTCTRAQEDTAAAAHLTAATIALMVTAKFITDISTAVNTIEGTHIAGTAKAQHTAGAGDHTHATTGAEGGQLDHGAALTGLTDDDHCFSEDTEILTDRGFVGYEYIQDGENVLTLNLDTDKLEYQQILSKYVYDNFTEMVSLKNKFGEILVTPKHRMIFKNTTNAKIKTPSRKWFECTAEESIDKSVVEIPTGGFSDGDDYPFSNRFAELLGLVISEGHFCNPRTSGYGVQLYQLPGEQADYIETLLKELDIPYVKRMGQTTVFYMRSDWARNNIRNWLPDGKTIPCKFLGLRGEKFAWFLSGLILGDGSIRGRSNGGTNKILALVRMRNNYDRTLSYSYHSGNKDLIDKLSHLCTLNGLSAYAYYRKGGYKNGCWTVNIKNSRSALFAKGSKSMVPYEGRVWCVNVPNKTLVLRRNGFVFVAGNTQYMLKTTLTTRGDLLIRDAAGLNRLAKGTAGQRFRQADGNDQGWVDEISAIEFVIDGGGVAITTGVKGFIEIPFAGTIQAVTLLADQSGSIVVDIWKDVYANYPPTDADTITSATPPTITTATKAQDSTLTSWTTTVTVGDIIGFNVDSCTTITRLTVSIKVKKS
jgi:hypothetical protein